MDATRPSSSAFTVLKSVVAVRGLAVVPGKEWATVVPGEGWTSVECASKKALGCGEVGRQLVDGLTLYVRRAAHPDLTASMAIALSDDAAETIAADLSIMVKRRIAKSRLEAESYIKTVRRGVLVLLLVFRYQCINRRCYYLVYDSTDASLYMIPFLPREVEAIYTPAALPDRSADGLKLYLMARMRKVCPVDVRGRLCICTPGEQQGNPESDSTTPWQTKMHKFVKRIPSELCQPFSADVVFSFQGKIFWGDLSQGITYSDLGEGHSVVCTHFIKLPDEYVIEYPLKAEIGLVERSLCRTQGPAKMTRTMGCVKDSIKFVCIDGHPSNQMMKVLTLDLNNKLWKEDKDFSCSWNDIREQLYFMNPELRGVEPPEPQYPVLMEDGALFLLLSNLPKEVFNREGNYYVCSFDMHSKSPQCFGQVHNYYTLSPLIVPFNFFRESPPWQRKPRITLMPGGVVRKAANYLDAQEAAKHLGPLKLSDVGSK